VAELQPASFEVERFELGPDACLEVHGRWFGVHGRRFMRPTLTATAGGREHRLLAVLDHKPWIPEEGETWLAAFPWSTDPAALLEAELTVAPDVTVSLPQPSLPEPGRRRRSRSPRAPAREASSVRDRREPSGRSKDDGATHESRLLDQHDAPLRGRERALFELDDVKRDRDRLRLELGQALAAREAVIAERHDVIDAEVKLRIADLRAETERERAAAGQAAQFACERDRARAERAEALNERDKAHAERDAARVDRNRMLAQRDTARSRAEEAMRRWEATAELGTRRTQQRDAAASERDRVARERDAVLEERDRVARHRDAAEAERDAALEQRDRAAGERDSAEGERDRVARERDVALEQREQSREQIQAPDERAAKHPHLEDPRAISHDVRVAGEQPTERQPPPVRTGSTPPAPGPSARASTPASPASDTAARRARRPPPPADTRSHHTTVRDVESRASPQGVGSRDAADLWRTRLLAIAALLIALVVFIVILTAK
jgi:hypothetical protein